MSASSNNKTKKIAKPTKSILVQFNQIKGKKVGPLNKTHQWQQNTESGLVELDLDQQKLKQTSRDYLVIVHDPKTGKIQIKDAIMMEAKTKMVSEVQAGTTLQKWSIEHKKNMVSQFGTSKSKRKINQMLSNIIN